MVYRLLTLVMVAALASPLTGCVGAFVAGGAAGASVASDRRTAGAILDDQTIEIKALEAIYDDSELYKSTHVSVTSFNKVVLLTGEAPTAELRSRAEAKVAALPNVRHIYNEIAIAEPSSLGSRSQDALITTKVKSAMLAADPNIAFHVKVVTERRTVYLMGLVYRAEGDTAADVASRVGGVQTVVKLFEYLD